MTNLPDNLREMWADIYRLYDRNYNMENTKEAWNAFWEQAKAIQDKYGQVSFRLVVVVSEMLEEPMKQKLGISNPCTLEDMKLF